MARTCELGTPLAAIKSPIPYRPKPHPCAGYESLVRKASDIGSLAGLQSSAVPYGNDDELSCKSASCTSRSSFISLSLYASRDECVRRFAGLGWCTTRKVFGLASEPS